MSALGRKELPVPVNTEVKYIPAQQMRNNISSMAISPYRYLRAKISGVVDQRGFLMRRNTAYLKVWLGRVVFWGGAIGVGLLAVGYALLSDKLVRLYLAMTGKYPWWPLLASPVGGALCVYLTKRFFQGSEGSGIQQVIAEQSRPDDPRWRPLLSLRLGLGKIFIGAAALGCGFSLGREGPTVQVGASLMNALHRLLPAKLQIQRNHLLVAGGAAGIAAAFNAPLAGVMFAIEELSRNVESRMSGLVITAIILAGVVAQAFLGKGSYFGHIDIVVDGASADLVKAVAVAALVCGTAGGLFSRMLVISATNWTGWLPTMRHRFPVRFAAAAGLLIAALGMVTDGETFGSGYFQTRMLLDGGANLPWHFGPAKFIATLVSYLSGLPGGIFAPSLAIGAGIGHNLAPLIHQAASPSVLLVLCTAGFLAAVTQAPITSFVIVMEMVDGYSVVTGLMAVSLLSAGISRLLSRPLYHTLAHQLHTNFRVEIPRASI